MSQWGDVSLEGSFNWLKEDDLLFFWLPYGYWQLLPRAKLQVTSCVWGKKRKEWDKNQTERREGGEKNPAKDISLSTSMGGGLQDTD